MMDSSMDTTNIVIALFVGKTEKRAFPFKQRRSTPNLFFSSSFFFPRVDQHGACWFKI